MSRLVLALLLLLAFLASAGAARAGTRRALVVGANTGVGPDAPLRFAEDDASLMAATLQEVGAVGPGDVTLLTGTDLAAVRAAVRSLAARSQPDDELYFFFSGHGGTDGAHVDGQVWSWTDLRGDLDSVRARLVVAFVDACFSGALLTPKGLVRESPLVVSVTRLSSGQGDPRGEGSERGRYLVTSSGANELSYESGLIAGSPFGEALRSGLRGAADANRDGDVTLPELYDYVYGRTLSATVTASAGPQHPVQSVRLDGAGEVVLVRLRRPGAASVRGASDLGRCYVLDHDASRVLAELEAATDQVFLPPGEYLVKCVKGGQVMGAHLSLAAPSAPLDGLHYEPEGESAELAKGSRALSESRFALGVGLVSPDLAGALLLGYHAGSRDLFASVEAGVSWKGAGVITAGAGMAVPWWKLGRTSLSLGLEVAAALERSPTDVALGGGSFVEIEGPRFVGVARGFARLDLLATHPLDGGSLGATLVGSMGVELGR
jgi:hypothetical protein